MFSSPEAALRFAFRMRGKAIISSPSGVFTSKEKMKVRNENSLTAYDFHAQAGMIFGKIDRMPQDQQLWIFLTYGDKNERKVCAEQLAEVQERLQRELLFRNPAMLMPFIQHRIDDHRRHLNQERCIRVRLIFHRVHL